MTGGGPPGRQVAPALSMRAALAIAAATGFVALSYEILWVRVISYVTGGQPWTFGGLLGAYLLGIAIASRRCETFGAEHAVPGPRHLAVLAGSVVGATVVAYAVIPAIAALAPARAWPAALTLVAIAAGALGAALPLTAHLAIPPDERAGSRLSYVYLADIAGSAAGGIATGYLLLNWLSMAHANALLALLGLGTGGLLVLRAGLPPRTARVSLAATAAAGLACAALTPLLHERLWERLRLHDDRRFQEVIENRHGVIAVTADGTVMGGGVYDGAFSTSLVDDRNGILRAYLPAALHASPRRVLLVGLGSGSWAQVLANLPGVERLTVVEINPGYVELVGRHAEVASLVSNPRVEIAIDDARRWLRRHPERTFDVVVSNGSFNWREHATNLLSLEFVRLVKSRLTPDGLYLFNTTGSMEAGDTALAAFAHGARHGTFFVAGDRPIAYDGEGFARILRDMRIDGRPVLDLERKADLQRWQALRNPPVEIATRRAAARIITDDNMLTEFAERPWSR